jgi:hypothetical protein
MVLGVRILTISWGEIDSWHVFDGWSSWITPIIPDVVRSREMPFCDVLFEWSNLITWSFVLWHMVVEMWWNLAARSILVENGLFRCNWWVINFNRFGNSWGDEIAFRSVFKGRLILTSLIIPHGGIASWDMLKVWSNLIALRIASVVELPVAMSLKR